MYLTAQRVYSLKTKKDGVNAFLYRHEGNDVPGMSWDQPNIERVAEEYLGTRQAENVEIAPGGNRVLSYVDIVADDATSIEHIESATREFESRFSAQSLPTSMTLGKVAIRFGAQHGLPNARKEFATIAERALELLKRPAQPLWQTNSPLEVDVDKTPSGLSFSLRPETQSRLAKAHGPDWKAPQLSLSALPPEARYKDLVPILAGLELEQAARMGGICFYDKETGTLLAQWPQR